jgi:glycosyltransferase involved in cell wall biosynthesis
MTILYLYAELMGYNIPVLRELATTHGAQVHVVHWDNKKLTPYKAPLINGITYYKRSQIDKNALNKLVQLIKPDLVYVPNWYDKEYLPVCAQLRKKGVPVVAGLDNQWTGSLKQWFGCLYMRLYLRRFYSHIWVAGPYQFEFARRLGFKKNNIIFDFYSADVHAFAKAKTVKQIAPIPKKFLFVGRLEPVKGLDLLLNAWGKIKEKHGWDLTLIGDGSLKEKYTAVPGVTVKGFMQPEQLIEEISQFGVFILPSLYEPYGVVIHEFAAAGLPIIASDTCGAAPIFVRNGLSGFQFKTGDVSHLHYRLEEIISMNPEKLVKMSHCAAKRGLIITPQSSASSFISVLN